MLLGIASWLVNILFLLSLALLIVSYLAIDRPAINLLTFTFLLIFLATGFTLLMGLLGWLRPLPFLVVSLLGLAALSACGEMRQEWRGLPSHIGKGIRRAKALWGLFPAWLKWFSAMAVAVSILRFAFLIWALPPFVWDSLTYHLTNVAHWTQAGRIELFETPVTRIYSAANYEVLATWFTLFIHHDIVVEAAGLPVYLLAAIAAYSIVRGLNRSVAGSWLAALAYIGTPALLLATTGTKNDPHVAAYYLSALALIIELLRPDAKSRHQKKLELLIVLMLVVSLSIGTKAYIIHLLPGLLLIAFLYWRGIQQSIGSRLSLRSIRDRVLEWTALKRFMILIIIALAFFLAGYWNLRNLILTGNPFYPYGVAIQSETIIGGEGKTAHLSLDRLAANLLSLAEKFWDRQAPIGPDLTNTTGWGWFSYSIGLAGLIWGVVRSRDIRILFSGFGLSLILLFLSDRPSPWNMRYALWFPAIISIAFAYFWDYMLAHNPRPLAYAAFLVMASFGLNVLMVLNYNLISPGRFRDILSLPPLERDTAKLGINMPPEYEAALEAVPPDEPLGYNVHANGFIYPLYRADFSQHLIYIPISLNDDCMDVATRMANHGTRYLFVARGHTSKEVISLVEECADEDVSIRRRNKGLFVAKLP